MIMKTNIYLDNERFIAGITMRDPHEPEEGNMALHTCLNPDHIIQNRKKLAATLNCGLDQLVCANQTHSANIHKVTLDDQGKGAESNHTAIQNTDALYTDEPNLLLGSFTADCVPITFYDAAKGIIGVIHSGWKGTIQEISLKTFELLKNAEHCRPNDLHIYIGTALSQEKFEVDEDVYLQFKALGYADDFMYYNDQTHKYHIDNQQTVKKQCELAGIPTEQITVDSTCTYLNPEGFSYRQDKQAGRHLTFIMKKG